MVESIAARHPDKGCTGLLYNRWFIFSNNSNMFSIAIDPLISRLDKSPGNPAA
jgi:hypothetical protein